MQESEGKRLHARVFVHEFVSSTCVLYLHLSVKRSKKQYVQLRYQVHLPFNFQRILKPILIGQIR